MPAISQTPNPNIPSYFEFGTVVALGQRNVDIQLYDERRQRTVQHSFVLSKDSRADVVHVGDTVEVIYTPGVDWTVRRLVMLTAGIPKPGTPRRRWTRCSGSDDRSAAATSVRSQSPGGREYRSRRVARQVRRRFQIRPARA